MKLKPSKKIIKALVYNGLFWLFFLIFLVLTFPNEIIKERVIQEVEKATGGKVQIENLYISPLSVTVENMLLIIPSSKPGEKGMKMRADLISISPSIMQLIRGRLGASVDAKLLGGEIAANVGIANDEYDVSMNFDDIALEKAIALAKLEDINLKGKASGSLILFYAKEMKERNGTLELALDKTVVSVGEIMGFAVPDINMGKINTTATLKANIFDLKELKADSDELALNIDATGNINYKRFKRTSYNAHVVLELKKKFWDKNPKLVLAKDLPMTKPYLRKDNKSYGIKLNGSFLRPPSYSPWKK